VKWLKKRKNNPHLTTLTLNHSFVSTANEAGEAGAIHLQSGEEAFQIEIVEQVKPFLNICSI
jgi:hypothetical protein